MFSQDQHFNTECTHLIVHPDASLYTGMTEKLCSSLVAHKCIVSSDYISQSYEAKEWQDESLFMRFVTCSSPVLGVDPGLLFCNWTVLLYMSESPKKSMFRR